MSALIQNEEFRKAWIKNKLYSIPSGKRLLDAGAGEQQYKNYCSHLEYVSQDFSEYIPNVENKGLHAEQWDYGKLDIISDIISIPQPDNSFDAIMCTEVFEHIANPVDALKELARLLKPGGKLILTAPFNSITHFAPHYYYTGFSKYFYEHHLNAQNFEIDEIIPNGSYFHTTLLEINRLPGIAKKYSNYQFNRFQYLVIKQLSRYLKELIPKDTGSYELGAWGWHVLATKK